MKLAAILVLATLSISAFAQISVSDGGSSGTASGEGTSVSESSGSGVIMKTDYVMVQNDAIDVLAGLPASEEFLALKERLEILEESELSNETAARLILDRVTE